MNTHQKIREQWASVEDEKQKVLQKIQQLNAVYQLLQQVSNNLNKMSEAMATPEHPIPARIHAPTGEKPSTLH